MLYEEQQSRKSLIEVEIVEISVFIGEINTSYKRSNNQEKSLIEEKIVVISVFIGETNTSYRRINNQENH